MRLRPIVRTRVIVAFAAIMAASALVAVPEPVGSTAPSEARSIDPAQLDAVSLDLPQAPVTATAFSSIEPGPRSAGWLGPESSFAEPGGERVAPTRPRVVQPAPRAGVQAKNYWRFDGNISWYGPGFFGNGTACGHEYTRELMGVAHRTLPCGTLVT